MDLKQCAQFDDRYSGKMCEMQGRSTQTTSATGMSLVATAKRPLPGSYLNFKSFLNPGRDTYSTIRFCEGKLRYLESLRTEIF